MDPEKQIYYMYIINQHGQPIYVQNFLGKQVSLDQLVNLGSIFYTIDALTNCIIPKIVEKAPKDDSISDSNQLELLETDTFSLYCFHAITGLLIIIVCRKSFNEGKAVLKRIYEIYSDYVSKDPLFIIDQPIKKFQKFDYEVCKQIGELETFYNNYARSKKE